MRYFAGFQFDETLGLLWRDGVRVPLTAKAGAVLECLIQGAGEVFTKSRILSTVWRDTHVTPDNIRVLIREVRRALGDDARFPRLIRTLRRRGYEFIAPVSDTPPGLRAPAGNVFVGRTEEVRAMEAVGDWSLHGTRSFVLISGPAGIGKTALFEDTLHRAVHKGFVAARGQCIPASGPIEPYAPILDAIHRLVTDVPRVREIIAPHAPTLLRHLDAAPAKRVGAARAPLADPRLLREIVAALEELAANTPVVLALEDVQWLDAASLDVLRALVRRNQASRLWILTTSRPLDSFPSALALRQFVDDIELTHACVILRLKALPRAEVEEYVNRRFDPSAASGIARVLHRMCGGHPLLLTAAADAIVEQRRRLAINGEGPTDIRMASVTAVVSNVVGRILAHKLERLTPDERALVSGVSALGLEFSVWEAARATQRNAVVVEQALDRLAQRGEVIDRAGDTGRKRALYCFTHRWFPATLSSHATTLGNAS